MNIRGIKEYMIDSCLLPTPEEALADGFNYFDFVLDEYWNDTHKNQLLSYQREIEPEYLSEAREIYYYLVGCVVDDFEEAIRENRLVKDIYTDEIIDLACQYMVVEEKLKREEVERREKILLGLKSILNYLEKRESRIEKYTNRRIPLGDLYYDLIYGHVVLDKKMSECVKRLRSKASSSEYDYDHNTLGEIALQYRERRRKSK